MTRRQSLRTVAAVAMAAPLLTVAGSTRQPATTESTRPATAGANRPGTVAGPPPALNVMTYNVRFASTTGSHRWPVRRPAMRELLRRERPHVIGTQEGLYQQLRRIEQDIGPHYDWLGTGSGGGREDEFMAIFYDTGRLKPTEFDNFWLSDTPYEIASNTWGARFPRMATWARFSDLGDGGREFYVLNTHLDHVSQYARERSAELIAQTLARFDRSLPVLVLGDFNAVAHDNPVYDTLLAAGLVDTWDTAAERGPQYATFNNFRPLQPDGWRIDWILATPGVTTHSAAINTFSRDGRFPSDHLPVQASLALRRSARSTKP
ncbi:endonuclease/exonuclease/phosphatase family protein [Streptomyces sp. GESEQ-35]|uniref:endonuclease/exonuclease/phosphatase family protein n=1 Tax=Streptomyces sp. GESEQ-35 TaxID=2812657 RepID=UPI001B319CF2|nr:endonuclease/exonuclease/phosphatase family protein [Streptomyces sp. GESEQ-35]